MGSRVALGVLSCLGVAALSAHPASAQLVRVYATNSGGDAVSIIDPASHKTVASPLNDIEGARRRFLARRVASLYQQRG